MTRSVETFGSIGSLRRLDLVFILQVQLLVSTCFGLQEYSTIEALSG
jgi:hypothetical protein